MLYKAPVYYVCYLISSSSLDSTCTVYIDLNFTYFRLEEFILNVMSPINNIVYKETILKYN